MKDDKDAGTQSGTDEDLDLMTLSVVCALDTALPFGSGMEKN